MPRDVGARGGGRRMGAADTGTSIVNIDGSTLGELFLPCRACVYWERPGQFREAPPEEAERLKAGWFRATAEQFDPCGKLLYVDDEPAAYCQYAPPECVPGILEYDELAARVDKDGVFISCLFVREGHRGKGLGPRLLKDVIEDLRNRGCKAVETFARDDSDNNCSGPTRLYLAQGFRIIASKASPQGTFSLVRLDLGG